LLSTSCSRNSLPTTAPVASGTATGRSGCSTGQGIRVGVGVGVRVRFRVRVRVRVTWVLESARAACAARRYLAQSAASMHVEIWRSEEPWAMVRLLMPAVAIALVKVVPVATNAVVILGGD